MVRPSAKTSDQDPRADAIDRRESLLDAAAAMLTRSGVASVSMESVAAAAGVSRPLVYKHFANRHELLGALYQRESRLLHRQLTAAVAGAEGLEGKFRALIEGALAAQASRGATFAALSAQGARPRSQRDVQRRRDAATVRYFADLAASELGLDQAKALTGVRLALGSISVVLDQWRHHRTQQHADELAEAYVAMAVGGLLRLRD